MKLEQIIQLDERYYMNTFGKRFPVAFTHGQGCTLYDTLGREYTDFFSGIAVNCRQTRSAVLETIRSDFITTARAKGLARSRVIYQHMLPNALIPILNLLGGQFGRVIAGTVVIETVFSFPGVGTYLLAGITNRDYPVVRGSVLILAAFSAAAVLLVDITYGLIDPRIKAQYISFAARKRGEKS